jgi:hypothetical protein
MIEQKNYSQKNYFNVIVIFLSSIVSLISIVGMVFTIAFIALTYIPGDPVQLLRQLIFLGISGFSFVFCPVSAFLLCCMTVILRKKSMAPSGV